MKQKQITCVMTYPKNLFEAMTKYAQAEALIYSAAGYVYTMKAAKTAHTDKINTVAITA